MDLEKIKSKIITIQGQQVILDYDVATLYGVQTKEVNQAVKNNPDKFPEGYIITLTDSEKVEVVKNFDHLAELHQHDENEQKTMLQKGGEIIKE
jgi:hypothetical protein